MNNLSYLILLADIVPSLSSALCIASGFITIVLATAFFVGSTDCFDSARYEGVEYRNRYNDGALLQGHDNPEARVAKRFRKTLPYLLTFFSLWLVSFAVPDDKETYYAVAASEMGEEVIKSPTAGKALKALDAWLERQVAPDPVPAPAQ